MLPGEVWLCVFDQLPSEGRLVLNLVCWDWYKLLGSRPFPSAWKIAKYYVRNDYWNLIEYWIVSLREELQRVIAEKGTLSQVKGFASFSVNFLKDLVIWGNVEKVKWLLEEGAKYDEGIMKDVGKSGNVKMLNFFIAKGLRDEEAALRGAIKWGQIGIIKEIIPWVWVRPHHVLKALKHYHVSIFYYLMRHIKKSDYQHLYDRAEEWAEEVWEYATERGVTLLDREKIRE